MAETACAVVLNLHQPAGNLENLLGEREWEASEILWAMDRIPRSLWGYEDVGRVHVSVSGTLLETLSSPDFQRRAYTSLRKVPPGAVITYHGLAATVGQPDSQRAIGNTMALNPVPIFVPCHRVIRSDGAIGNYGGGVDRKFQFLFMKHFAWRLQFDYLHTHLLHAVQNDYRGSTGLVWRF